MLRSSRERPVEREPSDSTGRVTGVLIARPWIRLVAVDDDPIRAVDPVDVADRAA